MAFLSISVSNTPAQRAANKPELPASTTNPGLVDRDKKVRRPARTRRIHADKKLSPKDVAGNSSVS
ncbi:MAG: hypothetical protein WBM71_01005 [Sedimenticolaceae bacterium]|jgi:hypothetical protein